MWEALIITPLTSLLLWIYDLVGNNFGVAIIIFTILIRLITWPLNAQQMKGAAAMQELQNDKEWQAIQKKYKDDREKLAQEQMRIYKEKGIKPLRFLPADPDSIPYHHWLISKHHSCTGSHSP
jgi:YidC/Oxa1 family membrane protein insertase